MINIAKIGELEFIPVDQTTVKVVISKTVPGVSLTWYHMKIPMDKDAVVQSDIGHQECDSEMIILIEGLVLKATYTFCLIEYNNVTSPLNCRSYYTGDDDPDIWLTKDAQAVVLSVLILCLLLMFTFGCLFMYFTAKVFPQIVRGSRIVGTYDNLAGVNIMQKKRG